MEVALGSKWISSNFKMFEVIGLEKENTETWVKYTDGHKNYSCLIDAFLERFVSTPD